MHKEIEYTHKERAVNFTMQFASITDDSQITTLAKRSAKVALNRNIENFTYMAARLKEKGYFEIVYFIETIIEDEKLVLNAVENL